MCVYMCNKVERSQQENMYLTLVDNDQNDLERIKEKTFRFGSNIFKKQSLPYLTAAVLSFLTFDQEILTSSQRNNLNVGKVKQLGKEVPHRQAKHMF